MTFEKISVELHEDNGSYADKDKTIKALNVDYYGSKLYAWKHSIVTRKTGDNVNIVISPSDAQDKWSSRYKNCVGYAGIGTDKNTGEKVSVLSHIVPERMRGNSQKSSLRLIRKSLKRLSAVSIEDSLDVVLFGGRVKIFVSENDLFEYRQSMKKISKQVEHTLGIMPKIVIGPATKSDETLFLSALIETQKNTLHLYRDPSISNNGQRNLPVCINNIAP